MTKARDLANAGTGFTTVSPTELGHLDGVTSALQTQLNAKQAVVSGVNSTEIGYLDGVTSAIQTQINTKANSASPTLTTPAITGGTVSDSVVRGLEEDVNIVASAATGTINIDVSTASIWYYTSNATANHTLNFRYSSGASLNSVLATGDAITVIWMNTNGTTAYYPNVIQVDGTTVTPRIQGGTAISSGNASSIDIYSFTIIKTAATPTYVVLESQTKFA
jgi:hypothetical protein